MAEPLIIWPVAESARITSKFGKRTAPTAGASTYHKGVDISVVSGTPDNRGRDHYILQAFEQSNR